MEDNTQLLEEMMRGVSNAGEPGTITKGQILAEGTKDIPLAAIELKSAGYVWIYDTVTGEQSKVNRNMLVAKLKQQRPDGTYVFSLKQTVKPYRGTMKCLLHPDDPNRNHYDLLGLAVCKKSNLTSAYQVDRHMIKRHKVEYATIKAEQDEKRRQEDRDVQLRIAEAMSGKKIEMPVSDTKEPEVYVSKKDREKIKQ